MKGAANVSLSIHDVANIEIPCPPLVVQAKILEKIDIFSGKYLIFLKENDIQLNLLNNLLNTILQEAIRGTFTSKWRKQHPELICGDNHASQLFVKIQKEKGQLIKEGKINKEKRLSPIIEKEKPFDLPQGWIWCRLGNISEWRYGKSLVKTQYKSNGKYPVFGSNGIVGYFDKYLTSKPSIVIGRKGSAGALNKSEMPSWTTDVAFYIEESKFINFVYLFILLKSLKIDSIGKGIKPGINRNEAYNLLVPLAPANEQKAIVEKVTKIMFLIDQLEKQIAERKELSEMLVQAVLREAFEAN
jgi:type I restriction enzyme S subunit